MMGVCYLFEVAEVLCKPCVDISCRLCNSCFAGCAASPRTLKNGFFSEDKCVCDGVRKGADSLLLSRCALWFVLLGGLILVLEGICVRSMNKNIQIYYG